MSTTFARQAKLFFAEPFNPPLNYLDQPPPDFDAAACPILARHFFSVEPPRPIGVIILPVVRRFEIMQEASDALA